MSYYTRFKEAYAEQIQFGRYDDFRRHRTEWSIGIKLPPPMDTMRYAGFIYHRTFITSEEIKTELESIVKAGGRQLRFHKVFFEWMLKNGWKFDIKNFCLVRKLKKRGRYKKTIRRDRELD